VTESALMAAGWAGLGWMLGGTAALLVIVIPMLVANGIIMSYIVTNHLLRPLDDHADPLASSMSVSTHVWLDRIHFNFSHHVEHHLFPSMSSRFTPLVRGKLRRYASGRFLAPVHWKALLLIFRTPRIHDGRDTLLDPPSGRRVSFAEIGRALEVVSSPPRPTR
jgi:fatty acid desaturase